jgi:thiamine biosynthesis lipoprotein
MSENTYRDLGGGRAIFYGWGEAMHTRFDAILCHRPQAECEGSFGRILGELKRLEGRLNRFEPSSDIARINDLAADGPVRVDEELWGILVAALRYGAMTAQAFDATYASRRGRAGERLHLDPGKRVVLFRARGTSVDLGGFGKGYGLQRVQNMLLEEGWTDFLLNFGNSSVCARGDRPGACGWTIGVEDQSRPGSNALEITLRDQSLNTSGNTPRHDGHIYSPACGEYVGGPGSVSVVTDDPLEGEVLSTALFADRAAVEGRTPDFLRNFPGVRAYRIVYSGGGSTVRIIV